DDHGGGSVAVGAGHYAMAAKIAGSTTFLKEDTMSHIKPKGSFVALVTPMNADGSVDFEGFRTLLNWHAENGTEAVLIMGSTGEVSMLSADERRAIISATARMK